MTLEPRATGSSDRSARPGSAEHRAGSGAESDGLTSYRRAVAAEFRRSFRPPFNLPLILLANAAMMVAAWFWLPRAWLFSMTGAAAFPMFLASWMYADVPATNILGADRERSLRVLRTTTDAHHAEVVRLLRAKLITLWLCVSVPCLFAAVLTGLFDHRPGTTAATLLGIVILPLGPLRIAACIGLAFPYHPRTLRWRWEHRQEWQRQLRWLILIGSPYLIVPFLLTMATTPSIWFLRHTQTPPGRLLTDEQLFLFVALACGVSALLFLLGARLSRRIIRDRLTHLIRYLDDVDLG